jgi:hypothetical protein
MFVTRNRIYTGDVAEADLLPASENQLCPLQKMLMCRDENDRK